MLIIHNNNNNSCNNNIKTITNIITTPTTPTTEISESWPFSRYLLRSTFYNLSDLPPPNPSPRSFINSKISVTSPLKFASYSQSKSSSHSSCSKSVSRSHSKSSLRSKSLSCTHSKGSFRHSKSELFPPTIEKSYDPNHYFFGLCENCKQPCTGILWCQSYYTSIFRKDFDNWTSGNSNIDEFIKKTQ